MNGKQMQVLKYFKICLYFKPMATTIHYTYTYMVQNWLSKYSTSIIIRLNRIIINAIILECCRYSKSYCKHRSRMTIFFSIFVTVLLSINCSYELVIYIIITILYLLYFGIRYNLTYTSSTNYLFCSIKICVITNKSLSTVYNNIIVRSAFERT